MTFFNLKWSSPSVGWIVARLWASSPSVFLSPDCSFFSADFLGFNPRVKLLIPPPISWKNSKYQLCSGSNDQISASISALHTVTCSNKTCSILETNLANHTSHTSLYKILKKDNLEDLDCSPMLGLIAGVFDRPGWRVEWPFFEVILMVLVHIVHTLSYQNFSFPNNLKVAKCKL